MRGNLSLLSAILVGLSAISMPAQANDITDILRTYIGGRATDRFVGNQTFVQSNVNTGLVNLSAQLNANVANGQLTPGEEARLRSELSRITTMRDDFMADGGYTQFELQAMLNEFQNFNSLVGNLSTNNNIASNPNYGRNGYFAPTAPLSDFDSVARLQSRVKSRINHALASHRLTPMQGRILLDEYDQIASQLDRRTMRGNFNMNPTVRRLAALDTKVSSMAYGTGGRWY